LKRTEAPKKPDNGNAQAAGQQAWILDRSAVEYLAETFTTLARLCQKVECRKAPVEEIRQELTRRWQKLRRVLAGRRQK
jgi:hypothetical protein